MRITRALAVSAAAITAVAGAGLATASPAAAATGVWRAYGNTNPITSSSSSWFCSGSQQIGVNVFAQTCVVDSAISTAAQPAIIVRNDKPVQYNASASIDLFDNVTGEFIATYNCPLSGVALHSWSVCFGTTRPEAHSELAIGDVNNRFAGDAVD